MMQTVSSRPHQTPLLGTAFSGRRMCSAIRQAPRESADYLDNLVPGKWQL